MRGIAKPTALEKTKADWRIEAYLAAVPGLRRERAERHAVQTCVLERELGRKKIIVMKRNRGYLWNGKKPTKTL